MLIDVITVVAVKVTIVKVIRMIVVPKTRVPASLCMVVVVIGVRPVFHGTRLSKRNPLRQQRGNLPSSCILSAPNRPDGK